MTPDCRRHEACAGVTPSGTDADNFADFVRPHWTAMAVVAGRIAGPDDRDDALQDALVRAWRHRGSFDPTRGTPRTWLLAVTANAARRTAAGRNTRPLPETVASAVPAVDPLHLDVERAIATLSERQRLAVTLYYFAGLSVRETAEVMNCAEGTVKSTLSSARSVLRELLEDDDS